MKTTTLLGLLERTNGKSLFVAFNKSIQVEIEEKIQSEGIENAKARTLHSLGFSSLRGHYKNVVIDNNKNWKIINDFQSQNAGLFRGLTYKDKMHLIFTLLDMLEVRRIYNSQTFSQLKEDMYQMGKVVTDIDNLETYWNEVWEIYKFYTPRNKNSRVIIDFADMIFLPAIAPEIKIKAFPQYLFVDECQDLNYSQHLFFEKLVKQGNIRKWVAVGDKNQSIYGFGGSYSKSFESFLDYDNTKSMILDICYRCPTRIVAQANQVYDVMEAFKTEPGVVEVITNPVLIEENSMIVCRNSAPLIKLFFYLIGQGKVASLKGKDILGPIISYLKKFRVLPIRTLQKNIAKEIRKNSDKATDQQRIAFYVNSNRLENITLLALHLGLKNSKVSDLITKLKELMRRKQEEGSIELCTIHKSKGLEKDVVYILNEHLIPSPFAVTTEQKEQEKNLKYVARTRAKQKLFYLNLN